MSRSHDLAAVEELLTLAEQEFPNQLEVRADIILTLVDTIQREDLNVPAAAYVTMRQWELI